MNGHYVLGLRVQSTDEHREDTVPAYALLPTPASHEPAFP